MSGVAVEVAKGAVQTAKGGEIATGIWTLIGVVVVAVMGAFGVWMKQRGGWKQVEVEAETQLRSEMWKDIQALKLSKEETSRRLTLAEAQIAGQTVRLGQQAFIINMLLDELERLSPGNTIARSARALLNMQADQMPHAEEIAPMAEMMSKLCVSDEEKPDART